MPLCNRILHLKCNGFYSLNCEHRNSFLSPTIDTLLPNKPRLVYFSFYSVFQITFFNVSLSVCKRLCKYTNENVIYK